MIKYKHNISLKFIKKKEFVKKKKDYTIKINKKHGL